MTEVRRILDQLRRAWSGNAWHGPAVRELLDEVDATLAFRRPAAGSHSIAEIVMHILTWEDVVRRRLDGETIVSLPEDQDWPRPPEGTAEGWQAVRRRAEEAHRRLEDAIAKLPEARLEERVSGKDYTVYVMLHGIVQHTLYHAGQIGLLRKAG